MIRPTNLPQVASQFPLILRVPHETRTVRVIVQEEDGGRIGSAEIDRKTLHAAPARKSDNGPA